MSQRDTLDPKEVPMLCGVPNRYICKAVPFCFHWPPLPHYHSGVPANHSLKVTIEVQVKEESVKNFLSVDSTIRALCPPLPGVLIPSLPCSCVPADTEFIVLFRSYFCCCNELGNKQKFEFFALISRGDYTLKSM